MAVVGSTSYLTAPVQSLLSGRPLWLSLWVRGNGSVSSGIAQLTGAGVSSSIGLYNTGGNLGLYDKNDTGSGPSITPVTPLGGSNAYTGPWVHTFAQVTGALGSAGDTRTLFTNGAQTSTSSSALSGPQTFNQINIGRSVSGITWYGGVSVAEVSAGAGILSAAQIQALAAGESPLRVCGANLLLAYYPLRGNLAGFGPNGLGLAVSATGGSLVYTDHPPVDPIAPRRIGWRPTQYSRGITDSAATSDTRTGAGAGSGGTTDSAASSDAEAGAMASIGALADTAASSDAWSGIGASLASLGDVAAASDAILSLGAFSYALADTAASSDAYGAAFYAAWTVQDFAVSSDTTAGTATFAWSLTDLAATSDAMVGLVPFMASPLRTVSGTAHGRLISGKSTTRLV